MPYLVPVATFGNKFTQVKRDKNKDIKVYEDKVIPKPTWNVNFESVGEISSPLTPKRNKRIQVFQAKQLRMKLRGIFTAWKRDALLDPLSLKLEKAIKTKTKHDTLRKVYSALALNVQKNKENKLKKQLTKAKDEILNLKVKVNKIETEKSELLIRPGKAKKKVKTKEPTAQTSDVEEAVVPARPILPAKLDQPTLVKLGLEKIIKTVIDSQIITQQQNKEEEPLITKQNFKHLINVFGTQDKEEMSALMSGPSMSIVEDGDVHYKQYSHIVMRWAGFIIKKGLKSLQK